MNNCVEKKRLAPIILFLALIAVTAVSIFMPEPPKAADLEEVTTESESERRTDFVDANGNIAFAADRGFATVVQTLEDGRVVKEEYLDEHGNPVVLSSGFDSRHRTYNEAGQADTDTYYIGDTQVERKDKFWGYQRIYTEDQLTEMHYLDREGNLTLNADGIAIVRRTSFEGGYIDFYFDTEGKPVTASLGQYGVKSKDGVTTYLDAEGNPANTNKGYAIVKRIDDKTLYYDVDGNPATIGRSQYGTQRINGQTVFLDANGEPMIRLDNILNSNPLLVLVVGIALTIAALYLKGKTRIFFTIVYILFIGIMTIAYRETGDSAGQLIPFQSYLRFFSNAETRQNILNNIWLFVPLGAILYRADRRYRWLWCLAFSVGIEILQYFTGIGFGEVDDVISNTLGGWIGFELAGRGSVIRHRRQLPIT